MPLIIPSNTSSIREDIYSTCLYFIEARSASEANFSRSDAFLEISSEALFNYAAKLSKVDLSWPSSVIGKNSYDGIRSGILYGFLGQADFLVEKIIQEASTYDKDFDPKVIATGGLASIVASKSKFITIHDPDLTLKGLKILVEKNSGSQ